MSINEQTGFAMEFEADLDPASGAPRIRFNFDNGWSASIVLSMRPNETECMLASVAACPTGEWSTGKTEMLNHEAYAGEAVQLLAAVAARPDIMDDEP